MQFMKVLRGMLAREVAMRSDAAPVKRMWRRRTLELPRIAAAGRCSAFADRRYVRGPEAGRVRSRPEGFDIEGGGETTANPIRTQGCALRARSTRLVNCVHKGHRRSRWVPTLDKEVELGRVLHWPGYAGTGKSHQSRRQIRVPSRQIAHIRRGFKGARLIRMSAD